MGKSQSWFGTVRRKFFRSSPQETIIVLHTSATFSEEALSTRVSNAITLSSPPQKRESLSKEDIAAIKIQAFFRGHLVFHSSTFLFHIFLLKVNGFKCLLISWSCL
uniref:Uncharacterized protein n=1 Tax=Davidia involucrata TaxID=16924 RepID=A0A5B6YHP6_DAVIN